MGITNPGLADVIEKRKQIAADLERLKSEDFDLETAERVLRKMTAFDGVPTTTSAAPQRHGRNSTQDFIIQVLLKSPSPWLTTEEVQTNASIKAGREIPMGTVGPTLSNMKREGLVFRDGNKVAHVDRKVEAGIKTIMPGVTLLKEGDLEKD